MATEAPFSGVTVPVAEWESLDVQLEDQLLRGLRKKRYTAKGIERLRRTAEEICRGDEERLAAVLSTAESALCIEADDEREQDLTLGYLLAGAFLRAL
jgi:hypothetical protein